MTAAPADVAGDFLGLSGHPAVCTCPICTGIGLDQIPVMQAPSAGLLASSPLSSLPQLSSRPGATAKLVLDFNGNALAAWGGYLNVITPVFDQDGDRTTFSDGELSSIQEIWSRVAEDYAPFNIDVTTSDPGVLTDRVVAKVAIGGNWSDWYGASAGGVAYVGGFFNSAPNVGFAFSDALGAGYPKYVAEAAAHEAGHLFGLQHQASWSGTTLINAYNQGDANWAPIMGAGYYSTRTTWFNGATPTSPTSYQDDMAILAGSNNGFGYRPDDFGSLIATASALPVSGTSISFAGVIGQTLDVDVWNFTTVGGTVNFELTVGQDGANLDSVLELRNSAGVVISTAVPTDSLSASLSVALGSGTYYLLARGMGDYGDVGQYTITGTLPTTSQLFAIDAGGSSAGAFGADQYFSGGATYGVVAAINTNGVTNPAPQSVYQTVRYGDFTYVLSGLTPGASYTVRLHFAEIFFTAAGQRIFNVQINGSQVLTNFDILAAAGAANKALVTPFTATADTAGRITVTFASLVNSAVLNGIEVLTFTNAPPTVANTASVSSNPVTGVTTNLSVLGNDANTGESSLSYSWSVISAPTGAPSPSFNVNGTNAAKNILATFFQAGNYTFRATITDPAGTSVTSDVSVTVNQTASSVGVAPPTVAVINGGTQAFTATVRDQFGAALSSQPSITWTLDGGSVGSVNNGGLYTAPSSGTGSAIVRATSGGLSGTATVTVTAASTLALAIDAGGGPSGSYVADQSFSGGSTYSTASAIDTSGVSNSAPQAVYQTVRYGNFTYTLSGLTPGGSYTGRLHFAEIYLSAAGQRIFNVQINGSQVLTNFDIVAIAGAANKAVVTPFTTTADAVGKITVTFASLVNNAMLNGIDLLTNTAPHDLVLDAGGGSQGAYGADQYFSGGAIYATGAAIDTNGATDPAPQSVYQTARYGDFTYVLPGLTPGGSYTVRLHFAEIFFTAAGQRIFNVQINGSQVLTGFDILATAGAANKAVVTPFTTTADGAGTITLAFAGTVNNAMLNGIEVLTNTAPADLAIDAGGSSSGAFGADQYFSGGATYGVGAAINTNGVTNPAPQSVYQTVRYGDFTYVLPGLTPSASYTVRLHFAEIFFTAAGQRIFNVQINGSQVLTNFDILATAGAANKAVVAPFTATADAAGRITVTFASLVNSAVLNGIEVLTATTAPPIGDNTAVASAQPNAAVAVTNGPTSRHRMLPDNDVSTAELIASITTSPTNFDNSCQDFEFGRKLFDVDEVKQTREHHQLNDIALRSLMEQLFAPESACFQDRTGSKE